MSRTFIPTCITRGHVEVFTAKGTETYSFSHLSASGSMDIAQRNAFAAVENAVRSLPRATGFQFVSGTETTRLLGALPTSEPRLKLELVTPSASKPVTLTLTPAEAKTLLAVCYRIGGNPEGRRGHIDTIRCLLTKAGIEWRDYAGIEGELTLPSAPVGSVRKVG